VRVRNGMLTLQGEKKAERDEKKDTYHLVERSYGAFQGSFKLPDIVDEDQIAASFDKGVLKIVALKRPEAVKAEKRLPSASDQTRPNLGKVGRCLSGRCTATTFFLSKSSRRKKLGAPLRMSRIV
jgi:hypothetical protein